MGVWEYGSMGINTSASGSELTSLILNFLTGLNYLSVRVSNSQHSHTPILPYSHTPILFNGFHHLVVNGHRKSNRASFHPYTSFHAHFDFIIVHQHAECAAD